MADTPTPDLDEPLDDAELERLDDFLFARLEELDADLPDDADIGVLDVSELDGFLTAVASAPVALAPADWLPALWGEHPPAYASASEQREIETLLLRHLNGIVGTLEDEPGEFEPIFLQQDDGGRQQLIVDDWCSGYLGGMQLAAGAWEAGGVALQALLDPILRFATPEGADELEQMKPQRLQALQQRIGPAAVAVHGWWARQRAGRG
ncbi:MAG TPA: UPF0149 family protein [Gammaproteobacteria bacterium]